MTPLLTAASLLADLLFVARCLMRNNASLAAEIVFLRKQLAMFVERGARPRRASNGERLALIALSGLFAWREALVVVRPATLIGWHRRAFRLFWSWKSRLFSDN